MNDSQQIAQSLTHHDGILAVAIYNIADGDAATSRSGYVSNTLDVRDYLGAAFEMFRMYGFKEPLRIFALSGDEAQSICCFRDETRVAIVMAHTGHKVLKSLRRMTMRALYHAAETNPTPNPEIGAI